MKLLVTGAAGFTGTWLVRHLLHEEGVELRALVRQSPQTGLLSDMPCIVADLLKRDHLIASVANFCPDAIIHLGGLTRGDMEDLLRANVIGTKNILDAGFSANPACRMLVVSSSAVYGYPGTGPIPESTPLRPLSDYGISKMAQEALAQVHHARHGSLVALARPFNLAGPGQPESFLCGSLVRQIVDIEKQRKNALDLRETASSRDLIDVRDVVRGYWALVSRPDYPEKCSGRAFNLGAGRAYPVPAIIAMLEEITGRHYRVNLPEEVLTPSILSQKSDNSRVISLTGWKPQIPLMETLRDMLEEVRRKDTC